MFKYVMFKNIKNKIFTSLYNYVALIFMTSKMLINITELNNIELINQQYYELMIHNY